MPTDTSAAAKNLKAIDAAINEHKVRCGRPEVAIVMNPLEVDRLGWDEYLGIPIEGDYSVGTGKVFVACNGEDAGAEEAEAVETRRLTLDIEVPVEELAKALD